MVVKIGHILAAVVLLWVLYTIIKTLKLHILNVCEYIGGI